MENTMSTTRKDTTSCCGAADEACCRVPMAHKCASEVTCTCGSQPVLQCDFGHARDENTLESKTYSCQLHPIGKRNCTRSTAENLAATSAVSPGKDITPARSPSALSNTCNCTATKTSQCICEAECNCGVKPQLGGACGCVFEKHPGATTQASGGGGSTAPRSGPSASATCKCSAKKDGECTCTADQCNCGPQADGKCRCAESGGAKSKGCQCSAKEKGVCTCTEERCNCGSKPSVDGTCGCAKEEGKECQCAARKLGKCTCSAGRCGCGGELNVDGSCGCEIVWLESE